LNADPLPFQPVSAPWRPGKLPEAHASGGDLFPCAGSVWCCIKAE